MSKFNLDEFRKKRYGKAYPSLAQDVLDRKTYGETFYRSRWNPPAFYNTGSPEAPARHIRSTRITGIQAGVSSSDAARELEAIRARRNASFMPRSSRPTRAPPPVPSQPLPPPVENYFSRPPPPYRMKQPLGPVSFPNSGSRANAVANGATLAGGNFGRSALSGLGSFGKMLGGGLAFGLGNSLGTAISAPIMEAQAEKFATFNYNLSKQKAADTGMPLANILGAGGPNYALPRATVHMGSQSSFRTSGQGLVIPNNRGTPSQIYNGYGY